MKRQKRAFKPKQTVNDGFSNFTMKLGVSVNSDNQLSQGWFEFNNFTRQRIQLEAGYRTNWLCSSLVDCVAQDMTRAGVEFMGEIDPIKLTELGAYWNRSGIMEDILDGVKWGRLYGGAIALILTKNADYSKPLDTTKIKKGDYLGMVIYDRWQLTPDMAELIQEGRDIGLPLWYDVLPINKRVHHSHIVRFIGDKLPHYQAVTEMLWGASILENVIDRIIAFETVTMGTANLTSRAHLRTVKVDSLRQIFATGGKAEENLVKQFSYIRQMQNNEGITLLDKTDEFETSSYSFAGLSDVILQFVQQISGAKRIPLPILFGESPAGLNATGDSDIRIYYDGIQAKQSTLNESMNKIARIVYQSLFGEQCPDDLSVKWNPLWQHTTAEKADITTKTVTSVIALHEAGIFDKVMALKEIKQLSDVTGFGTNITDDDLIDEGMGEYSHTEQEISRTDILNKVKGLLSEKTDSTKED